MTTEMDQFRKTARTAIDTNMNVRQAPLVEAYAQDRSKAEVIDYARTSSQNAPASSPLYSEVFAMTGWQSPYPVGVHTAVGGESDFPTPGDILCASLAACLDSCIRMIANKIGVKLKTLSVEVEGRVNVCSALRVDTVDPVGFRAFDIKVEALAAPDVPRATITAIVQAAEQSCIVMQTLTGQPQISVTINESAQRAA